MNQVIAMIAVTMICIISTLCLALTFIAQGPPKPPPDKQLNLPFDEGDQP